MPSVTYSGSFGGNRASQGLTATATGSALPSGAVITGVSYTLKMTAERSSSNYRWVVSEFAVGGQSGSPYADYKTFTMSSHEQTLSGSMNFSASDVEKFNSSNITVYVDAHTTYDSPSYAWDFSVTVDYEDRTACSPPTTVTVEPTSVAPDSTATLKWSGAKAGNNNAITGYEIHRSTEADGEYSYVTTVGATNSATVKAPTANGAVYYYKVKTVGQSSKHSSSLSTASAALSCSYSRVGAPTEVKLAATNVAPGAEVTLSWSGARPGANNEIWGYAIWWEDERGEDYGEYLEFELRAPSGNYTVKAPTENGKTYYYWVGTWGDNDYDYEDIAWSEAYAALTCTYSSPTAPSRVTVNGGYAAYAYPGNNVVLSWTGAIAGANNAIIGYDIYRDGVAWGTGLGPTVSSYSVPAHDTAGKVYTYSVVTLGEHEDSAPSKSCTVYAFTDATPPATVTVSETEPAPSARVTLSWSGAEAGEFNAIQGYRIYRAETVNGEYSLIATHGSNVSSCYVDAPDHAGDVYYYRVETVATHSNGGRSTAYASVTASGEGTGADTEVKVVVYPKKKRKKRGFIFGDYDTANDGWTLTGWSFPEPDPQTNYVSIPFRTDGPLDMSTALTDGDPRYGGRPFTATFENSEGKRLDRDEIISYMVNRLHGRREEIVFPDDASRYAIGRLSVKKNYSDMAHAAVTVTATCAPWRYAKTETQVELLAAPEERTAVLSNSGRCVLVPDVVVTDYNANVTLTLGDLEWELTAGTYRLPELKLPEGNTEITYQGSGTLIITYREAIL